MRRHHYVAQGLAREESAVGQLRRSDFLPVGEDKEVEHWPQVTQSMLARSIVTEDWKEKTTQSMTAPTRSTRAAQQKSCYKLHARIPRYFCARGRTFVHIPELKQIFGKWRVGFWKCSIWVI